MYKVHLIQTFYVVLHRSYYPFWEGKVCIESIPVYSLSPINSTESGTVVKVTGWAFVAGDKPIRVSLQIQDFPFFSLNLRSWDVFQEHWVKCN